MKKMNRRTFLKYSAVIGASTGISVFPVRGVLKRASAREAEPILVGCPGSFKATPWALGGLYGVQLAVEEINAAGGVNVGDMKRPIKLISLDTRDEEPGVPVSECLLGIEKLILDDKVHAICGGPTMSEASMAVIDLIAKYNIAHLVCMGTWTPGWPKKVGGDIKKYRGSFKMTRNVVPELQNGVDLMENMKKVHGFDTAFVIIQDALFARNAMDFFSKLAVQKGWKIVGTEKIPMGTTDYSPALIKCKNSGAKVLLYWWADTTGSILYRQFKDLEVPAVPVGFSPASQEHEVYEAVGKKSDYFIFSMGKACVTSTRIPGATKFQKDFTRKFGKRPFGGCGGGYNGPYVLKDAIERAGSLKTDAIIGALEKTDYMSINGRVRFDNNHEVIYSDNPKEGWVGNWSQWIKGERVCVWPPLVADAQVVLPPWMKK